MGILPQIGWAIGLVSLVSCSPSSAEKAEEAIYPALTGRVVDGADLLSRDQEVRLSRASERLEREIGPQFVIVTVPDLQEQPIERYGVGLGRHWGIGHKDRNDGLLLIVAPNERKVRIEVGYGLEKRVSDRFAGQVIQRRILPEFRRGRYPEGIEAGSTALIERLRSQEADHDASRKEAA